MALNELTESKKHSDTGLEKVVTKLLLVLFALIVAALAVVILSVLAGDTELITHARGKLIAAGALAFAVASGAALVGLSIVIGALDHKQAR